MFVYTVHAALGRSAAQAVTRGHQAGIRLLATVSLCGTDGVVVLSNVQVQKVRVWEVALAL
jgi:orotidine-5'-phosphate decarboxylase